MSLKFGTSGLRGLAVDLVGAPSALYATAFGLHLLRQGLAETGDMILVARDFRESSPQITATCLGALAALGFRTVDCGTVPTPALALYGLQTGSASLMVTGSHIPGDRNGIKFYRPDGEIDKQDEAAINAIAAELKSGPAIADNAGAGEDHEAAAAAAFVARNIKLLPEGSLKGLKIGVYQHSTVARDLFVEVLAHYGADVVSLGRSADFIPVDTEAVSSQTVEALRRWTSEFGLDAIVSADGDGDRPLVSDETGQPLRGDLLGLIAARFLDADVVVTPVTSNSGIEAAGDYRVVRTRVGSPFVIAGMNAALADGAQRVMGFEANGGLLTASTFVINGADVSPLPTRDSFLPALAVLSLAASSGKTLSSIAATFALPVALSDRLENFPLETSAALMAFLRASPDNVARFLSAIGQPQTIVDIDGLQVTLADRSMIHFRPSGNAPEMRCYVEAASNEQAASLLQAGLAAIASWTP